MKDFEYKCICDWSKDDKYGFIPNTECPVHGKQVKEMLKDTVPITKEKHFFIEDDLRGIESLSDKRWKDSRDGNFEYHEEDLKKSINDLNEKLREIFDVEAIAFVDEIFGEELI